MNESLRQALTLAKEVDLEFEIIKSLIRTFPGHLWLKEYYPEENSFRIVAMSQKMCDELLGIDCEDCEGKKDVEVWGIKSAIAFERSDFKSLEGVKTLMSCDKIISPLTGEAFWAIAYKWKIEKEERVFIAGRGEKLDESVQ